jgi:hypothetical protein
VIVFAVLTFQGATGWLRAVFPSLGAIFERPEVSLPVAGGLLIIAGYIHFSLRRWAAGRVSAKILAGISEPGPRSRYQRAFRTNSRWWRSLFNRRPAGWGKKAVNRIAEVEEDAKRLIQILNDAYTNPSGETVEAQADESN